MEMAWSYAKKMKPYSYDGPIVDLAAAAAGAARAGGADHGAAGGGVARALLRAVGHLGLAEPAVLAAPLQHVERARGPRHDGAVAALDGYGGGVRAGPALAPEVRAPVQRGRAGRRHNAGLRRPARLRALRRGVHDDGGAGEGSSAFALGGVGSRLSFPAVSLVVGLLAAGAYTLDATVRPLVRRSAQFTSSNMAIALRNTADMNAGVVIWRALLAGFFVLGLPNAVWFWDGLKTASVGMATAQVFIAPPSAWSGGTTTSTSAGSTPRHGCVDMRMLKRAGSFFDMD